ncbi:hypothetical protein [Pseudoalteromonas sp. SK20]|uniref:hypothetical protein n=1 Tax=Pseudoalteromonas sp. SK20 TaxID=1938367 RepID=UPI000977BD4F|nr:hypothetical protein [Pseudoalteromonas sp. SK20]
MKAYIEGALSTIYTPLYSQLCKEIIKKPSEAKKYLATIKKMLLNSYYTSSVTPFENLDMNDADYASGLILWLEFTGHKNKNLRGDLLLKMSLADDEAIALTSQMLLSISPSIANKECTGLWKQFVEDFDKTAKRIIT